MAQSGGSKDDTILERQPEGEGWYAFEKTLGDSFEYGLPPLWIRARPDMRAQMYFWPDAGCTNLHGGLHGGFLSAIAEQSLALPLHLHGRITRGGIVVIDFSLSFLIGGTLDQPIVADVELLRETGRMGFLRGTLNQGGTVLTAYSGTVRKLPRPEN